jgi:hypothetical protein
MMFVRRKLQSGMLMVLFMRWVSEFIKPSVGITADERLDR